MSQCSIYLVVNFKEEQRQELKIDEVLSLYLIDLSQILIPNAYKMFACLIQLLRNCINKTGFEMVTGIKPIDQIEKFTLSMDG